ncbi:MAG: ATP-binding protein [Thermoguttaceae bacterium]
MPPLAHDGSRWVFWMADRSAAILAELLLEDAPARLAPRLAEQLAADPPLAIWTAWAARLRGSCRPRSASEAARWLAQNAAEVLCWGPEQGRSVELPEGEACGWADQVGASLAVADLARQVAALQGGPPAEEAYLAGLLFRGPRWFELASGGANPSQAAPPSDWIDQPAAACADRAAAILSGQAGPSGTDPEASRRRAASGRQQWLELLPGAGCCLGLLAARLARLRQLETQFQQALESEKLEAMAQLAAGAGHEINNPLAIIAGRAQLLLKDETEPERRRELASINAQVKRAHEMIADLHLFARPPRPEIQQIDLVQLADQVVEGLKDLAAERNISVRRLGEPGPLPLRADPAQLGVAIQALCKNAIEAIGQAGQIDIELRALAEAAEIRVSDNGPGIAASQRRHLFDPFYCGRQAGRGLGMGLAKCWRIVTNHGGRIEVESQPGHGARFTIVLPRCQDCFRKL